MLFITTRENAPIHQSELKSHLLQDSNISLFTKTKLEKDLMKRLRRKNSGSVVMPFYLFVYFDHVMAWGLLSFRLRLLWAYASFMSCPGVPISPHLWEPFHPERFIVLHVSWANTLMESKVVCTTWWFLTPWFKKHM